jgi:hypothetical protein
MKNLFQAQQSLVGSATVEVLEEGRHFALPTAVDFL